MNSHLLSPIMDKTPILLLACLGLVLVAQAQNCAKPEAGPNMDLTDEFITLDTFQDGAKVYFSCSYGYRITGGLRFVTCTAGTWSPLTLRCEKKNCGSPGEVLHGRYTGGTEFGDQATFICDTGYILVGQATMRCEDGGWTGRVPECEAVTCQPPSEIQDGTYSPMNEVYKYQQTVSYKCLNRLTMIGSSTIVCSEDGVFLPGPPKCTKVECREPSIKNGGQSEGSRPPHQYNAFIKFECDQGYFMVGQAVQTCGADNEWSPGLPECKEQTKPPKPPISTTTPSGGKPVSPKPTPVPGGGIGLFMKIGIPLLVIVALVLIGVWFFMRKKQRSRRNLPDKNATNDEAVALS